MSSRCWLLLSSVVAAIVPTTVWADAAPFGFLFDDRFLVQVQFDNLHEFPQYDFYLKGRWEIGVRKITSDDKTRLFGRGRIPGGVQLMAVPAGQKLPTIEEMRKDSKWFESKVPGSLETTKLVSSQGEFSTADDKGEFTYRVAVNGNELVVELVEAKVPYNYRKLVCISLLAIPILGVAFIITATIRSFKKKYDREMGIE